MKELLVLRHAKSSWDFPDLDDHDRPLNPRGERDAPRMGRLIRREEMVPQAIVASDAVRAMETAERVARECGFEGDRVTTRQLYLADPAEYLRLLSELPDTIESVLVVGHNPGLEDLVRQLSGAREVMPTAALARIALELESWDDLGAATKGRLVGLWRPRELPE